MSNWRSSREYRIWRATVIRRDGVCQICGSRKARHAHHINHATYFTDQRFDPDNGITLCYLHHMVLHTSFKPSYRTMCTRKDYNNYIELLTRLQCTGSE